MVGGSRNKFLHQRPELRGQMQCGTLVLEHPTRVSRGLESVAQVGKPHEPEGVAEVFFVADAKGDPAGVRNPAVSLCKTACQESIMDWARERDVNNPSGVHVSDFGIIF